jgi:malonate transporter
MLPRWRAKWPIILPVVAAYFHFEPAAPIAKMLTFLQNAAAPAALFVMGVTIALRRATSAGAETPALLAIKLVLHPLMAWVILSQLGDFGATWTFTAMLMAALPQALNVFVLANQYQAYVERASTLVLAGTLVSVVTLTTLLWLISTDSIPYRLLIW